MTQSHAVMAQRAEPHDSLDFFPTPPWATRALCEHVIADSAVCDARLSCWDPACGDGAMARALCGYFRDVFASDVHQYGAAFVESVGRYERLFRANPPAVVAQFVERVPMVKGRLDRTASTATSYCWLVWCKGPFGWVPEQTRFAWIPPCRAQLERDEDYPA